MAIGENRIIQLVSHEFDFSASEQYHLSLQVGLNNFSFCILDTKDLYYQYISSYKWKKESLEQNIEKVTEIINSNDILKSKFSSYSLVYNGFPNTLIPSEIKINGREKEMLEFQNDPFNIIYTDNLLSNSIKLIYSIPEKISNIVKTFFPITKCMSEEKVLIEQYMELQNNTTTTYLNIKQNRVIITIIKEEKLLLNNSFDFSTKEDLLYYVLFCLEQLKLSTEKTKVMLYGEINSDDENYQLLYEYIRHVHFGKRKNILKFPEEFCKIKQHQYFSLVSQILCE